MTTESKNLAEVLPAASEFEKFYSALALVEKSICTISTSFAYIKMKLNFIQKQNECTHEGNNVLVEYSRAFESCYVPKELAPVLENVVMCVAKNVDHAIEQAKKILEGESAQVTPHPIKSSDIDRLQGLITMQDVMKQKLTQATGIPDKAMALRYAVSGIQEIVEILNRMRYG